MKTGPLAALAAASLLAGTALSSPAPVAAPAPAPTTETGILTDIGDLLEDIWGSTPPPSTTAPPPPPFSYESGTPVTSFTPDATGLTQLLSDLFGKRQHDDRPAYGDWE